MFSMGLAVVCAIVIKKVIDAYNTPDTSGPVNFPRLEVFDEEEQQWVFCHDYVQELELAPPAFQKLLENEDCFHRMINEKKEGDESVRSYLCAVKAKDEKTGKTYVYSHYYDIGRSKDGDMSISFRIGLGKVMDVFDSFVNREKKIVTINRKKYPKTFLAFRNSFVETDADIKASIANGAIIPIWNYSSYVKMTTFSKSKFSSVDEFRDWATSDFRISVIKEAKTILKEAKEVDDRVWEYQCKKFGKSFVENLIQREILKMIF